MAKVFKRSIKKQVKGFKKSSLKQSEKFSSLQGNMNIVRRTRKFP